MEGGRHGGRRGMEEELERGTESVRSKTFRMYYILYIARFHLGEGGGGGAFAPLESYVPSLWNLRFTHPHYMAPPLKFLTDHYAPSCKNFWMKHCIGFSPLQ